MTDSETCASGPLLVPVLADDCEPADLRGHGQPVAEGSIAGTEDDEDLEDDDDKYSTGVILRVKDSDTTKAWRSPIGPHQGPTEYTDAFQVRDHEVVAIWPDGYTKAIPQLNADNFKDLPVAIFVDPDST